MLSPIRRQICPKGGPLLTPEGIPISCLLNQINACPVNGYICSLTDNGDAYCCPDPSNFLKIDPEKLIEKMK